jgi:hypothetical protein
VLREGKRLCAKKVRADVEGKVILTRGPRFCSAANHVLLQAVAIGHLCPGYWGRAEALSLSASEAIWESKPTAGVLCEKWGILHC